MIVKLKKLNANVKIEKAHKGDLHDLFSAERATILPNDIKAIKTGIALEVPSGYRATVRPRSGNSLKGLNVILGSIDNYYTGEIGVIIHNTRNHHIVIEDGQKIGQLAFERDYNNEVEFEEVENLSDTERGAPGFGSTDQKL